MNTLFKLVLKFLRWGEARFGTKAELIVTSMTTVPMTTLVPDPLPASVATRAEGTAALAAYKGAAQMASDGSKSAILDRDAKRAILEGILTGWAGLLELAAAKDGDINILGNSGYDLRQPIQPVPQPVAAPELKVFRNGVSGKLFGRGTSVAGGSSYEAQMCSGDPAVETNWHTVSITPRCARLEFAPVTPGQVYSFRLRALGRDGWGGWSDVAQIMAT